MDRLNSCKKKYYTWCVYTIARNQENVQQTRIVCHHSEFYLQLKFKQSTALVDDSTCTIREKEGTDHQQGRSACTCYVEGIKDCCMQLQVFLCCNILYVKLLKHKH